MGPWAFGVSLVLVSALGLLLNAYVLLVVLGLGKQTQQQQTANTVLLIHLGAVEAAVCLVLLIFTTGGWPISGSSCILHGFLLAVLHPVALWNVTALNCDRYCAIAAPLHYTALVSPRRVSLGLAASWAGALLLCIPPFSGIVPPYKYSPGLGCCVPDFGDGGWGNAATVYGAIYAFLGLALPAILVTVCNLRVLGIARYHRHRIASAIYEVTLSAQVTITHQRNPFFVPTVTSPAAGGPPRFHSAASTVMQLVGSIYLLYIPYCVFILWESIGGALLTHQHQQHRPHAHPRLASLASLLLASSPPINGLLYGLKSPMLRRSIRNYWRKKVTKSELQQEIQARTPSVAGSRRPSGSGPATVSLFPFPPLQRRLSEALINLANTRNVSPSFESGNIASFHRPRLQPAVSCNTLRVPLAGSTHEPSAESRGSTVRASASAASLVGSRYRNNDLSSNDGSDDITHANLSEIPNKSPKILITRAYSIGETREGTSPLMLRKNETSRCQKRRWRHISVGSDSSTGSSDASVWTTGITPKIARIANLKNCMENWPLGKRLERVRTIDDGGGNLVMGIRKTSNNSESSDGTDTTTTLTLSSKTANAVVIENPQEIPGKDESLTETETRVEHSESEPTSWSSLDEHDVKSEHSEKKGLSPVPRKQHRRKARNIGSRESRRDKRGISVEPREGIRRSKLSSTLY